MARADNKQKKLAVLQLVKEKKRVLFGSFQNTAVTKVEKKEAWKEVLKKAQSLGMASNKREWTYARDHIFGLWKSRTLAKKNNAKKTGAGGGKRAILDEVDKTILDILGNYSPVVEGLGLPETDDVVIITQNSTLREQQSRSCKKRAGIKRKLDSTDTTEFLKKQVLESELYKNKLQILQLERELELTPSIFTEGLQLNSTEVKKNLAPRVSDVVVTEVTRTLDFTKF